MTALPRNVRNAPAAEQAAPAALPDLAVDVDLGLDTFLARCERLQADGLGSPFHRTALLRAWYATLGQRPGLRPVLVGVRRADTGADLLLLPLVCKRIGGITVLEFADAGVVDYNAPLLASDWAMGGAPAQAPERARHLWQALRRALRPYGALRLTKMMVRCHEEQGSRPNPLALALHTKPCPDVGNHFHVPATWDEWRFSLDKHVRKEFERMWRVFTRSPQARFEQITDPERASAILTQLEVLQAQRMQETGTPYQLDGAPYRDFYRQALRSGLSDGSVVLTALFDTETEDPDGPIALVAAQFAVANGQRLIALRMCSVLSERWKHCSPGRLLGNCTSQHLHAQGLRYFDFGIGAYFHKNVYGVERIDLVDACVALSWRGLPVQWAWTLRRYLQAQPWALAAVRRWRARGQADIETGSANTAAAPSTATAAKVTTANAATAAPKTATANTANTAASTDTAV